MRRKNTFKIYLKIRKIKLFLFKNRFALKNRFRKKQLKWRKKLNVPYRTKHFIFLIVLALTSHAKTCVNIALVLEGCSSGGWWWGEKGLNSNGGNINICSLRYRDSNVLRALSFDLWFNAHMWSVINEACIKELCNHHKSFISNPYLFATWWLP